MKGLFVIAALVCFTVTAQAGGWGRGPSWGQARKIVNQAITDAKNGGKKIIICPRTDDGCKYPVIVGEPAQF